MAKYELWTDGSGNASTGGGWAYVIVRGDQEVKRGHGSVGDTTNNRMELQAVIEGLKQFDPKTAKVTVVSDSAYVVNCFLQKWYVKWRAKNWMSSSGPVKNRDLWEELLTLVEAFGSNISFRHIRGHQGHKWNELCDQMASLARLRVM